MEFAPQQRLGQYRLVEKLGEGGMGVVWRAVDTTLEREVAIKVLPDLFSDDPERRSRFEREAKILASLHHPGIATIHGLHQVDGVHFLAMELAPGTDLARRLAAGPLPVEEALGIALKIAEALEAAHDSGVIHRDLKPANIQITPDGAVKILDFGLAKSLDPLTATSGGSGRARASLSPTMTTPAATLAGVILGTAAYMSPEQAKGRPVDRRADIWAFGCVLYEMLTGKRTFNGEGVSEVIASVIMAPVEMTSLPGAVPARVRRLLRRCLEKDPRRRLRDIGEARFALEETLSGAADDSAVTAGAAGAGRPSNARIVLAAAGAAIVTATIALAWRSLGAAPPPEPPERQLEIAATGPFRSSDSSSLVAISPDGRTIAYVERNRLFLRSLASLQPVQVETAGPAKIVFWSPDSVYLGFAAGGKLWKVLAAGGAPTTIADLRALSGGGAASWCPDGNIIFASGEAGLSRVSAAGGDLTPLVPIIEAAETDLHDPLCLPDNSVIFVSHLVDGRPSKLFHWQNGKRRELHALAPDQDIWYPAYAPSGHLLYHRHPANAGVWALPYSLATHEVTGPAFLVAQDGDVPSVSNDGTLVYAKGRISRLTRLTWIDRKGQEAGSIGEPQTQWPFPALSPDGRSVAIAATDNEQADIFVYDVERGTRTRLHATKVPNSMVSWSLDGRQILYNEGNSTLQTMKTRQADGGGEPATLGTGWAPGYSPEGRYMVYTDARKDTRFDVMVRDTEGAGDPVPLVATVADEGWPRISPDGRYLTYFSDETGGDYEVYLKRFPAGEGKWQVSSGGGIWPRWSPKGDRLYYARGHDIMEVDVTLGPDPRLGKPRVVVSRKPLGWPLINSWPPGFDVAADGSRFLVVQPIQSDETASGIIVHENWLRGFAK